MTASATPYSPRATLVAAVLTSLLLLSATPAGAAEIFLLNPSTGAVHARVDTASVRTPDATVVTASGTMAPPPSQIVRGTLVEDSGCAVTGAKVAGGISAMVICQNGTAFHATPMQTVEGSLIPNVRPRVGCAVNGRCVVEIIADTDTEFVANSGGTIATAVAEIDALIAQANARYEFDFGITFRVFRYRIRLAGESDPYGSLIAPPAGDPNKGGPILTAMQTEWSTPAWKSDNRADLVHLFMGRTWSSSGASNIGKICGSTRVGWSRGASGATADRTALLIHEVAHSLGAIHQAGIMATAGAGNPFLHWNGAAGEIDPIRLVTSCMPKNEPPVAVAKMTCGENRTCSFDGRTSTDEEPLRYDWRFGGGQESTVDHGSVTYPVSGTYVPSLTVTDSVGQTHTVFRTESVSVFVDVPAGHWARSSVEAIAAAGITAGCGTNPRRFCPDGVASRAQIALFLLRGAFGPSYTAPTRNCPSSGGPPPTFADVACTHPLYTWIEDAAAKGIPVACGGGSFCPDGTVTRAAIAPMLLKARFGASYAPPVRLCPPQGPQPTFSDVACGHPQYEWIEDLAARGITSGCGAGQYCPGPTINRAAMAVFLARTFGLPLE